MQAIFRSTLQILNYYIGAIWQLQYYVHTYIYTNTITSLRDSFSRKFQFLQKKSDTKVTHEKPIQPLVIRQSLAQFDRCLWTNNQLSAQQQQYSTKNNQPQAVSQPPLATLDCTRTHYTQTQIGLTFKPFFPFLTL